MSQILEPGSGLELKLWAMTLSAAQQDQFCQIKELQYHLLLIIVAFLSHSVEKRDQADQNCFMMFGILERREMIGLYPFFSFVMAPKVNYCLNGFSHDADQQVRVSKKSNCMIHFFEYFICYSFDFCFDLTSKHSFQKIRNSACFDLCQNSLNSLN